MHTMVICCWLVVDPRLGQNTRSAHSRDTRCMSSLGLVRPWILFLPVGKFLNYFLVSLFIRCLGTDDPHMLYGLIHSPLTGRLDRLLFTHNTMAYSLLFLPGNQDRSRIRVLLLSESNKSYCWPPPPPLYNRIRANHAEQESKRIDVVCGVGGRQRGFQDDTIIS